MSTFWDAFESKESVTLPVLLENSFDLQLLVILRVFFSILSGSPWDLWCIPAILDVSSKEVLPTNVIIIILAVRRDCLASFSVLFKNCKMVFSCLNKNFNAELQWPQILHRSYASFALTRVAMTTTVLMISYFVVEMLTPLFGFAFVLFLFSADSGFFFLFPLTRYNSAFCCWLCKMRCYRLGLDAWPPESWNIIMATKDRKELCAFFSFFLFVLDQLMQPVEQCTQGYLTGSERIWNVPSPQKVWMFAACLLSSTTVDFKLLCFFNMTQPLVSTVCVCCL